MSVWVMSRQYTTRKNHPDWVITGRRPLQELARIRRVSVDSAIARLAG